MTGSDDPGTWRGELTAVRHGESLANVAFAAAEAAGSEVTTLEWRDSEVPLSPAGRRQAAALGRWLRERPPPGIVYCSPYERARETWRIAAGELPPGQPRIPVVIDERLRDREMGQLELLTAAAVRRRYPRETERRAALGEFRYRPPGGESLADVASRLRGFLRGACLSGRPLVIGHDAVVLMLRHVIESLDQHELAELPPVANASVTRWATSHGRLRLVAYNDLRHLGDAPG